MHRSGSRARWWPVYCGHVAVLWQRLVGALIEGWLICGCLLLAGAELDYAEALMGSHFAVKNPNAASSCGCGTSFSPA